MLNFFKQFDLQYWLIENILWEFIFIPFAFLVWYLVGALKISKYLLKNNRLGLGTGARLYLADRFIKIWHQGKSKIYSTKGEAYSPQKGFLYAYMHVDVIDNILLEKKLIFLEREIKSNKDLIRPKRTIRNRFIVFFLKFYLIYFWWDGKEYYKDLKNKK